LTQSGQECREGFREKRTCRNGHRRRGTGGNGDENRCYYGWLDGREHYGNVSYVDEDGAVWMSSERVR
jgi:hypothetical protein